MALSVLLTAVYKFVFCLALLNNLSPTQLKAACIPFDELFEPNKRRDWTRLRSNAIKRAFGQAAINQGRHRVQYRVETRWDLRPPTYAGFDNFAVVHQSEWFGTADLATVVPLLRTGMHVAIYRPVMAGMTRYEHWAVILRSTNGEIFCVSLTDRHYIQCERFEALRTGNDFRIDGRADQMGQRKSIPAILVRIAEVLNMKSTYDPQLFNCQHAVTFLTHGLIKRSKKPFCFPS